MEPGQMQAGRVVVLNGSSSAGVSSLAQSLQTLRAQRGECWVILGWDDFVPRLPARWIGIPGAVGDRAAEGASYREIDGDAAIFDLGPVGRGMLAAYHRAVAAVAASGVDVLVDEVMITPEEWEDWNTALSGLSVRWVAIRCDLDVAAERERRRDDRLPGLARGTGLVVHRHPAYDIEVDTSLLGPDAVAAELDTLLAALDR